MIKNNINLTSEKSKKLINNGEKFYNNLHSILDKITQKLMQNKSNSEIERNLHMNGIICHTEANPMKIKEYREYLKNSLIQFDEVYLLNIRKGFYILGESIGIGNGGYCVDAKLRTLTDAIDKNREISYKDVKNITDVYIERLEYIKKRRYEYPYFSYIEYIHMNNISKIYESFKEDNIIKYLLSEKEINIKNNKNIYVHETNELIKSRTSLYNFYKSIIESITMENNNFIVSIQEGDFIYNNLLKKFKTEQNYGNFIPIDIIKKYKLFSYFEIGTLLIGNEVTDVWNIHTRKIIKKIKNKEYILIDDKRNISLILNKKNENQNENENKNNLFNKLKDRKLKSHEFMTDNGIINISNIESIRLSYNKSINLIDYGYYDYDAFCLKIKVKKLIKNTIFYDNNGYKYVVLDDFNIPSINSNNLNNFIINTNKGKINYYSIEIAVVKSDIYLLNNNTEYEYEYNYGNENGNGNGNQNEN
jgi:hypothetical protein